ncbi:MAG: hypothetical protein JWO72_1859 [Caulobacteraceae bacterium]|nr:hypothetical protein [Caulobacteraceae bacterium]
MDPKPRPTSPAPEKIGGRKDEAPPADTPAKPGGMAGEGGASGGGAAPEERDRERDGGMLGEG